MQILVLTLFLTAAASNAHVAATSKPGVDMSLYRYLHDHRDTSLGMPLQSSSSEDDLVAENIPAESIEGLLKIERELLIDQIACEAWAGDIPARFMAAESDIPEGADISENLCTIEEAEAQLGVTVDLELAFKELNGIEFEDNGIQGMGEEEEPQDDEEYHFISEAFFIARHHISNEQYSLFAAATGHPKPENWVDGKIPEGQEKQPVANISLADAQAYAAWINMMSLTLNDLLIAINVGKGIFQQNIDQSDSVIQSLAAHKFIKRSRKKRVEDRIPIFLQQRLPFDR